MLHSDVRTGIPRYHFKNCFANGKTWDIREDCIRLLATLPGKSFALELQRTGKLQAPVSSVLGGRHFPCAPCLLNLWHPVRDLCPKPHDPVHAPHCPQSTEKKNIYIYICATKGLFYGFTGVNPRHTRKPCKSRAGGIITSESPHKMRFIASCRIFLWVYRYK